MPKEGLFYIRGEGTGYPFLFQFFFVLICFIDSLSVLYYLVFIFYFVLAHQWTIS